jgi:hypothetical protein
MASATKDNQVVKQFNENFEIFSLSGTVERTDCRLHIAAAKRDGSGIGGRLKDGTIVDITAEIVLGEDDTCVYALELDPATGFEELVLNPHPR